MLISIQDLEQGWSEGEPQGSIIDCANFSNGIRRCLQFWFRFRL